MKNQRIQRCVTALVLLVAMTVFAQTVLAIQPVAQNEMYEVEMPRFAIQDQPGLLYAAEGRQATESLNQKYGGNWQVFSQNPYTRTPHYVYGGSQPLTAGMRSAQQVESLARQVMADNPDIFRADLQNLRLRATPHAQGKWVGHFQQTYHGLDVWQGKTLVAFSDDGRLLLMGSDYYRDIDVDPTPSLAVGSAEQIAIDGVPFDMASDRIEGAAELLVLPVPTSPTEMEYHLAYRIRVRTNEPLGIWVTHVDAHDGRILWRYNDIHFDHGGDTGSLVQQDTYCNDATVKTVPYLRINGGGSQTISDADGSWSIPGNIGSITVSADLYGTYVDMNNFTGPEAAFSGVAQPDEPFQVSFHDLNSQQDERDTFDAVNQVHDFFELFAPGFGYSNQRINAYVSRNDGYCPGNAWWDGTINFCVASATYGNTGEIQGVVFHEFGHGVQDHILGWQGDEGLGEGNSDILACLMTDDAALGRGFYLDECDSGLRNADNDLIYPDDVQGQSVHSAGRVILGFQWDAYVLLKAAYGDEQGLFIAASNWHYGRTLLQPTTQPDQVFATFFADDDDGNLDNGTPNHAYYCEAADNHNFDCPEILVGVLFSHIPLTDTTDNTAPFTVQTSVFSTEADLVDGSVVLSWRANGGTWTQVEMTDLGYDNLYEGQIPSPTSGLVEYYFSGEDAVGNSATLPSLAPEVVFDFLVATSIDPVETDSGWSVGDTGDDATSGIWVRVNPVATSAQPEDDHTVDGTICWVTGQHQAGQGDGYQDVDGGKTTLFSPIYDLSGYDDVMVRYWKWYSNNRGNAPGADYWDVSISNDGGSSWVVLEHTMESTNAWVPYTVDLADHFAMPGQVQLKFVASDESTGSLIEAAIDDLVIVGFSGVAGVDDGDLPVQLVTDLGQNHPNPFNPKTRIEFNLAKPGVARLSVYDVSGRLIKTLVQGDLPAGPQTVYWDGTASSGQSVATGVYFYRLEADGQNFSRRMVLLK